MIINIVAAITMGVTFAFALEIANRLPEPALFYAISFMLGSAAERLLRWWMTP